MYQIKTFNAIAPEGLNRFEKENYAINESDQPDAIILRSQKLHDYAFPSSVLAVARAGAGTNNIPVDACTEKGIVVFNTPGANANAVKELVLASLLMSVRPILKGAQWVQSLSGENAEEQVEANKKQFDFDDFCDFWGKENGFSDWIRATNTGTHILIDDMVEDCEMKFNHCHIIMRHI